MKVTPVRIVLIIAILVQIIFLVSPRSGADRYRLKERTAAFLEWKESGLAAAKAAFDAECALADKHEKLVGIMVISGFFLVNGTLCYFFWNFGAAKKRVGQGGGSSQ